jgi:hypothetical protein
MAINKKIKTANLNKSLIKKWRASPKAILQVLNAPKN